ncbi:HAD family phosphatase [Pseudonocardia sp. WMMC193]|uniref:HAD family hydrolase n=1 Tax=Pseudonocardia sp. WMMC193 TaxID=2911965 RepID=UPI001F2F3EA3|nr:HAD family phosphatase [Pseudonocardia sp. WMMC193]MCF7548974.1 HAD family phosphatase [Pseudonocardia sp. WMMC193]
MPAERAVRPPAAVLFDMDGTLIDSEKVWDRSLVEVLRWLGGTDLSAAARRETLGGNLQSSLRIVFREAGVEPEPELFDKAARMLVEKTAEFFADGLPWRPGAPEALRTVRAAGIPVALVTNTGRHLTDKALDGIGRAHFDVTVCGDEVPHGKPAPDPYLRAAALLDVPVGDCVAVEDSPTGIRAAETAGAAVLAVPCEVSIPDAPGRVVRESLVGLRVEDLSEVLAAVRRGR